jgi:antitoxin component YwqK of YwqJK toxin-antitoxin module
MSYLKLTACLIGLLCLVQTVSAQDTTIIYYNKHWETATADDSIVYYRKKVFQPDTKKVACYDYYASGNIQMTGTFADDSCKKREGVFIYYYESGIVESRELYVDGLMTEAAHFFPSGQKEMLVRKESDGHVQVIEAFDSLGKPIKNYVYQLNATFPGGVKA